MQSLLCGQRQHGPFYIKSSLRMKLDQVAQIYSGFHFRGKIEPDPSGVFNVIQIKDITPARRVDFSSLTRVSVDALATPPLVRRGDVLFLSRGPRQYAVPILEEREATVAPSYFYILRPKNRTVRPDYLSWYLNQEPFQGSLRGLVQGTHMPFIPKHRFSELEVVIPPVETQEKIVALNELLEREEQLAAELALNRRRLVESLCIAAAHGATVTKAELFKRERDA